MDYQQYSAQIKAKFIDTRQVNLSGLETLVAYEEVFKWEWIATKLKIFTFLSYADKVDEDLLKTHTKNCLQYAYKNKKGLPRGLQNGIVSYSILASENIDPSAITFVSKKPKKHYSAFEMPIIVDLSKNELYYYKDKIVWGALYDSYMTKYLLHNFSL